MSKQWPDHVQLALRMTSEEINEARREAEQIPFNPDHYYRSERASTWRGVTRDKAPYGKTANYWHRAAETAREVAAAKTEKKARKFWLKRAKQYEEKADETAS